RMFAAELMQVVPGEEAGVVAVVEGDADGVVAHGFDLGDGDVLFAGDENFRRRSVALHLGAWAFDAEIFRRQLECGSVVEGGDQNALGLLVTQLNRPRRAAHFNSSSVRWRASSGSMIGMPARMG